MSALAVQTMALGRDEVVEDSKAPDAAEVTGALFCSASSGLRR